MYHNSMLLELSRRVRESVWAGNERGMATVELLGNAALAVIALVAIWGLIQTNLAPELIEFIKKQITGG